MEIWALTGEFRSLGIVAAAHSSRMPLASPVSFVGYEELGFLKRPSKFSR